MFTGNWRFFVVRRVMLVSVTYCLKPQGWNNQKLVWIFPAGLFPHQARKCFIPTGDKGRQEAFRAFLQLQNYWGVTQLQSFGQSTHAHTHTLQAHSAKSGFAVCLTLPNSLRMQLDANRVILKKKYCRVPELFPRCTVCPKYPRKCKQGLRCVISNFD